MANKKFRDNLIYFDSKTKNKIDEYSQQRFVEIEAGELWD